MPFRSILVRLAGLLAGLLLSFGAFAAVTLPTVTFQYTPNSIPQGSTSSLLIFINDPSGAGFSGGQTTAPFNYFTGTGTPGIVNTANGVYYNTCSGSGFAVTAPAGAGYMTVTGLDLGPGFYTCYMYVEVTTSAPGTYTTDYPSGVPFTASTGPNTTPSNSTLTSVPPYIVSNTADTGAGSLRQTILDANSTCNGGGIVFNIPGTGPFTISPASPLPALTCSLTINGFTQPGASPSSASGGSDNASIKIALSGASCGTCDGLTLNAPVTVRGLAIRSFSGAGIKSLSGGVGIFGNYIGTDPGGMNAFGNNIGILVGSSTYATIGSGSTGDGNLISGNATHGVLVSGGGATFDNNLIGGQRTGNPGSGGPGNLGSIGNGAAGIFFQSANYSTNNVSGNYIRYNGGKGVVVDSGTFRALATVNSIFGNGGIGIDLNDDGPTPNDEAGPPYDSDSGPNNLQNYPVITSVTWVGSDTVISGYLKSVPMSLNYIEIFLYSNSTLSGNTEGQTPLGVVPTGALTDMGSGYVTFSFTVAGSHVNNISATVFVDTCGDGCTYSSEYSPMVAIGAPTITLTPPTLGFGSLPASSGTSPPQSVTLLNNGPGAVTPTVTISGDFGFISNCPGSVAALATCTIDVTFTPLVPGLRVGTLSVASNASGSPNTVALSGTGLAVPTPDILVTPGVTDFGAQGTGTDSPVKIITVNSTGTALLTLGTIDTTLADFVIKPLAVAPGRACGATLAPGDSCDVAVVFHPTALGIRDAQLRVVNNSASSPATARIVGRGDTPPRQLGMVATLTFGSQPVGSTSAGQALVITNNTASAVSITGLDATGDFSVSNACTSVAARGTCTVLVSFTPTAVGARTGAINVRALADSVPYTVALSGTGTVNPNPALRLSATILGFGNVIYGSSASQGMTLSNVGQVPVTLLSIGTTGNSDFTVTQACGTSLAVGAACNLSVNFAPHALGARSATLNVTSNASGSPHHVQIGGTGCRYFSPAAARFFLTSC